MVVSWPRIILHADMDAFFAAVEQLNDPGLRGKPVIVGGPGRRGVVSTASYEARPFGVHSAMPMALARKLCPEAIVVPPGFSRYKEASRKIMEVFDSFSPLVEPLSLDEAFLDMTGAEDLFGTPEEMGRKLKRDVFEATGGLTVSVGATVTKFVAKVASDFEKPDGLTVVPPDRVLEFLHPLEVSRLWGVGKKSQEALDRLGLRTIGDVARTPETFLVEQLGELGRHIARLARAEDPREVVPSREAKSVGAEYTLEKDVRGAREIRPHIRRAASKIARRLRRQGLHAAGVRVKLKTSGFRLLTRQAPLSPPTDSERELVRAAETLLDQFDLTVPMRLVGLAAFHLRDGGEPVQPGLFSGEEQKKDKDLQRAMDDLKNKFGEDAVRWGGELE